MVMFVKWFLNVEDLEFVDIEWVVDYIMYVVVVVGWDYIGIGGDFDGIVIFVNGISLVVDYFKFILVVMKCGVIDE